MEKTLSRRSRLRLVCLQCKQIKRKCDKVRPVCSRCQQHSLECKYEDSADLSSNAAASGLASLKTSHKSNSEYQLGLKWPTFRCSLQVPEGVINTTLSIWHAEDMLVIVGQVTFLDYPFAAHGLSQHDQYVRALCASLYGMTLMDFSNYANGIPFEDSSRSILGPLSFIEKAILRRIEHSKLFRVQPTALGMLYNGCSIEEDNSVAFLSSLVVEIEGVLAQKKDCEILLKCFYENIYPFYPFMDIGLFENDLSTLLLQDDDSHWKINTEEKHVRKKVETLSLLTVIMAMALKHSTLDADLLSMVKANTSETSTKLTRLCHRLLCLLDVFRYPNENTFTCLLYFYVSEHLDPESPDCVLSHTNLLTLNHLSNLSITLGLQYEPSKYKRFKDSSLMRHRRMLWLGIQSLKFQISLAEGDSDRSNGEYMEPFLANFEEVEAAASEDEESLVGELNVRLHDVTWNKYRLHIILSKLVSSCTSIIRHPQLFEVLENIKRLEGFLSDNFAAGLIYQPLQGNELNTIKLGRDTLLNTKDVEKTEIFLTNIVGRVCIFNILDVLSLYFEKKCIVHWEEYEKNYHFLTSRGFGVYLELAGLVSDYLDTRFEKNIPQQHGYIIDKQICFILVRIWMFQCRILLRCSYKQESLEKLSPSSAPTDSREKENEITYVLARLIQHVRNQMAHLVDLAREKLQDSYFCAYQTVPIFKYIVYLVDVGSLVSASNELWEKVTGEGEIPQKVQQAVRLKWGLDCNNSKRIKQNLTNSQSLESFNKILLCQMEEAVLSSSFGRKSNAAMSGNIAEEIFNISEEEALNQLLENGNFDAFWELLGENLTDMPSL
ncbi:hypothetical protein SMKI_01G0020 [Saccharomyces mikatae IFO 1815]|uniref:Zn(2)-C6 fungal-type domain-containing protein n=1 Tax=Saccharomyces mikatae IFO 1815 TaxID=226126 RepID=A0AA35IUA0_SACMI|nr:uncharacterized protein SMKI_01G0020 [Saccharomyces mikatae IFO 1815]CAI4037048.1 hypothetical protein SMKI_01G0020 [Saccharomyces mikatae IFO 1815]